jgi:uncharacterized membrane protein
MNPLFLSVGMELIKKMALKDDRENERIVKEVMSKIPNSKPFWKSKRFWMTMAGVLIPIANKVFGLELSVSEITPIVGMIAAYVLGKSHEQKG